MEASNINTVIGKVWDRKSAGNKDAKSNWWHFPEVYEHIGRKIHGSFVEFIRAETDGRVFERAVSVGCGSGTKEMRLIEAGLVDRFDLFELSKERIATGQRRARARGFADRMRFHLADAFAARDSEEVYDLVHWNNSLHHMLDTRDALAWSRRVLRDGGVIAMDDFVGPSRFQWTDFNIRIASEFRRQLPARLLRRADGQGQLPVEVVRRTVQRMIEMDPSEAADSGRILLNLRSVFPDAKVVLTGGAIYHLALAGVYANLDLSREEDMRILKIALLIDDLAMQLGESHYAVAVARK